MRRWELGLLAASVLAAAALVLVAAAASTAMHDRHTLVLEGRLLRLGHRVELALREAEPARSGEILAAVLDEEGSLVAGLALADLAGKVQAETGSAAAGQPLELDLFLGRAWRFAAPAGGGAPMMHGGGRRRLILSPSPGALERPWSERLLLPSVSFAGVLVVGLSILGAGLLRRQRETAERAAERQRLEGLVRAGAGLAHQLRNPLATIKGSCQLLLEDAPPGEEKRLRATLDQAERMERLLTDLLDYARPPQPEPREVFLETALRDLAGSEVVLRSPPELASRVDPEHLRQILSNLLDNARQAGGDAPVEVAAARRGDGVEITVADRGPGLAGDPELYFEPYVTRRADGTGLGLPIARALAQANHGELILGGRPGGGTVAALRLPGGGGAANE